MIDEIRKANSYIEKNLSVPDPIILEEATGPVVRIKGKDILMFGSYNYLNLANQSDIKRGAVEAINKYGVGSGGVRLLTGTEKIHIDLEKEVSKFTGHEDSMTIASGYGTNVGVIPGLVNLLGFSKNLFARKAVIFSDELNHASIVDGCKLSDATIVIYKHNDIKDLEKKLSKFKRYRKLIVTDGVFSMDGDIAPLDKIIDLANEYDACTMVDDAHSFGILGETGAGTAEFYNRKGQVDINMGTFSKGIGVSGGFISGSREMIKYLRLACRSYMFSDSLSPAVVGAIKSSLRFIFEHPEIIKDLLKKSTYFRNKLNSIGFNTFMSKTQIVPIFIGEQKLSIRFSQELYKYGLFAPAIRWPAVSPDTSRIRFAICSGHSYDNINRALEIINEVGKKLQIIK